MRPQGCGPGAGQGEDSGGGEGGGRGGGGLGAELQRGVALPDLGLTQTLADAVADRQWRIEERKRVTVARPLLGPCDGFVHAAPPASVQDNRIHAVAADHGYDRAGSYWTGPGRGLLAELDLPAASRAVVTDCL